MTGVLHTARINAIDVIDGEFKSFVEKVVYILYNVCMSFIYCLCTYI